MFGSGGGGRGSGGGGKGGGSGKGSGPGRGRDREGFGAAWKRWHDDEDGHMKHHRGLTEFGRRRHALRMSRAEQGAQTREEILRTAMEKFSEHGFSGTSMRMLAQAIGASQALLHFHFGSKMDLYRAVMERMQETEKGAEGAEGKEAIPEDASLLDALESELNFYQKNPARAKMALWASLESVEEESPELVQLRGELFKQLEVGAADGHIRKDVSLPHLTAMLLGGILVWPLLGDHYSRMLPRDKRKNNDALYNELFLEILLRGAGTEALEQESKNRQKRSA